MAEELNEPEFEQIELTLSTQFEHSADPEAGPSISLHSERYQMLQALGAGAMGEVLAAQDQNLRRKVAYKQIRSQMAVHPDVLSRFVKEAQITAQLGHPNIIPIYDLELDENGKAAYSMKLIQGQTLKELLQQARQAYAAGQTPPESCSLETLLGHFLKVCDAMHYAHIRGVIHRDLKPANLMIGPYGEVYVMDWGIARLIEHPDLEISEDLVQLLEPDQNEPLFERTQLGKILGTPRYMSPQQAAGKNSELDGRSDQFALGLILFEMVSLNQAFQAPNQLELLKKVLKAEKEPLVHRGKQPIAPELAAIIHKATARKPADRYLSTGELADDLRRYLRGEAVHARPDNALQTVLRWMGQHRQLTAGLLSAVVVLCALLVGGSLYSRQQAMKQAHQHEQQLYAMMTEVLTQTQRIDSQLIYIEGLLRAVGSLALDQLQFGSASNRQVYLSPDYRLQPQPNPPDLKAVPAYTDPVSFSELVFQVAPKANMAQAQALMRKLSGLAPDLRQAAVRSALPDQALPPLAEQTELMAQGKVPLVWINLGWEAGLMVTYPGAAYKPDYDPRIRPWYRIARGQQEPVWGPPYPDAQGQGLLLSCSLPLYTYQHEFVGVGALDLLLNHVAEHWLPMPHPAIRRIYLLNPAGEIVSELHKGKLQPLPENLDGDTLALNPLPNQALRQQALQSSSGHLETPQSLFLFARIETLDWTYLVEADPRQVFGEAPQW